MLSLLCDLPDYSYAPLLLINLFMFICLPVICKGLDKLWCPVMNSMDPLCLIMFCIFYDINITADPIIFQTYFITSASFPKRVLQIKAKQQSILHSYGQMQDLRVLKHLSENIYTDFK